MILTEIRSLGVFLQRDNKNNEYYFLIIDSRN